MGDIVTYDYNGQLIYSIEIDGERMFDTYSVAKAVGFDDFDSNDWFVDNEVFCVSRISGIKPELLEFTHEENIFKLISCSLEKEKANEFKRWFYGKITKAKTLPGTFEEALSMLIDEWDKTERLAKKLNDIAKITRGV